MAIMPMKTAPITQATSAAGLATRAAWPAPKSQPEPKMDPRPIMIRAKRLRPFRLAALTSTVRSSVLPGDKDWSPYAPVRPSGFRPAAVACSGHVLTDRAKKQLPALRTGLIDSPISVPGSGHRGWPRTQ
ncbi:hypothetical protein GCM10020000_12310 [Streptomyces olivoverticillatus]